MLDEYDDDGNIIGDDSSMIDSNSEIDSNDDNLYLLKTMTANISKENKLIKFGPAGTVMFPPLQLVEV